MNSISSSEGFSILRNWQTHRTLLWFFSLDTGDFATRFEGRITALSEDHPEGLTFESGDVERPFALGLESAEFFRLDSSESPFPGLAGVRTFLGVRRPDPKPIVIFAELLIT